MNSERYFKFACPICGQHIQAEARSAGGTLECPTCFKPLNIPHPGSLQPSALILKTTVADTSQPRWGARLNGNSAPESGERKAAVSMAAGIGLVLLLAAVVLLVKGGGGLPTHGRESTSDKSGQPSGETRDMWTLDLQGRSIPEQPVRGRLNGWGFEMNRAVWRGTMLILRSVGGTPTGLEVAITVPIVRGHRFQPATFEAVPWGDPFPAPVQIRWRDEKGVLQSIPFTHGYAIRLEFTAVSADGVAGRVYLCLPDEKRSWAAGTFEAVVRRQNWPIKAVR